MSSEESLEEEGTQLNQTNSEDSENFGPASLGLHRVGTALPKRNPRSNPIQKLNARGMPARIRKKNKFYDDEGKARTRANTSKNNDTETDSDATSLKKTPSKSPAKVAKHKIETTITSASKKIKKEVDSSDHEEEDEEEDENENDDDDSDFEDNSIKPKISKKIVVKTTPKRVGRPPKAQVPTPETQSLTILDKKACQRVGLRLRNLLKLPKAHKFVMYEFFYSNIDKPLLVGGSDFEMCLRETFPKLKTRMMTKTEWNKIRFILGKPRRMSSKVRF